MTGLGQGIGMEERECSFGRIIRPPGALNQDLTHICLLVEKFHPIFSMNNSRVFSRTETILTENSQLFQG
jgi:hypothetical protein